MTWGFYGMLLQVVKDVQLLTIGRLRKSKRSKRGLKSFDDCCSNSKCRAELLLILPTADRLYGLWSCKTESW